MKTWTLIFVVLLLSLNISAGEVSHEARHGHHQQEKVVANGAHPEKKFLPDKTLQTHMETILSTMKALGKAPSQDRKVLLKKTGQKLEKAVQDIFKNCKLAPAADAAIHPVLANILKGAKLIGDGNEGTGHEMVHQALLDYEKYFDHPGWDHDRNE